MDAQERVEVVLPAHSIAPAGLQNAIPECCPPRGCRAACALDVVDSLLCAGGKIHGEEVDTLLDLRWLLHHHDDAERLLALFCQLRLTLEPRHYLAVYRLRRWLENHVEATVRTREGAPAQIVPLKLERYCLEAVRGLALRAVADELKPEDQPRVRFQFRDDVGGSCPVGQCCAGSPTQPTAY